MARNIEQVPQRENVIVQEYIDKVRKPLIYENDSVIIHIFATLNQSSTYPSKNALTNNYEMIYNITSLCHKEASVREVPHSH